MGNFKEFAMFFGAAFVAINCALASFAFWYWAPKIFGWACS